MKLIFQNSYGEERVIAEVKDESEAIKEIHKFIDECNAKRTDGRTFEIYYIRSWQHGNRKVFDLGSWSEFFLLELENNKT
jgi:hypothetical protein